MEERHVTACEKRRPRLQWRTPNWDSKGVPTAAVINPPRTHPVGFLYFVCLQRPQAIFNRRRDEDARSGDGQKVATTFGWKKEL